MEKQYGDTLVNRHLAEAAEALKQDRPLCFVMGNEAADLDSMATAVVFSAYKDSRDPKRAYIPVIPIPKEDFPLRTEAAWLFEKAGVDTGQLIFLDHLDLDSYLSRPEHTILLVDHNKLSTRYEQASAPVTEILDHHADEGHYPDAVRMIAPVGSAATLAAEQMLANAQELIDTDTAVLLLGTILLDTVNLDVEAKRVTPRDEAAAKQLLSLSGADQKEIFAALQFEKFNVASLSSMDILRKDYKEYRWRNITCGISSTLLSLKQWGKKDPNLADAFKEYASKRKLDMLLAMCSYMDPEFQRELAVYSCEKSQRESIVSFLNEQGTLLKPLPKEGLVNAELLDLYTQGDLGKSRKKIQPLLSEFFS